MNRNLKHIILALSLAFAVAGCQDTDMPEVQPEDGTNAEETVYLAVNLALNDGGKLSRATEGDPKYEDGTESGLYYNVERIVQDFEDEVICADFYIFRKNKTYRACIHRTLEQLTINENIAPANDNIETVVVPINSIRALYQGGNSSGVKRDDISAYYILVVLNDKGRKFYQKARGKSLDQIKDIQTSSVDEFCYYEMKGQASMYGETLPRRVGHFIMTNSSYMNGTHEGAPTADTYYWGVPISEDNIQTSPVEAAKHPIEIYVERRFSKQSIKMGETLSNKVDNVNFHWNTKHEQYIYDGPAYLLDAKYGTENKQIVMQFYEWAGLGSEKKAYYMKRINEWGSSNDWLNNAANWNSPADCRSFWGKSAHYDTYKPEEYAVSVEQWAKDKPGSYNNGQNQDASKDYVLNYFSLNDISGSIGVNYTLCKYSNENTPGQEHIEAMNERFTVPHWLLTARVFGYWENGGTWEWDNQQWDATKMPKPLGETANGIVTTTFFRWDNRLWSEKDLVAQLLNSYQSTQGGFNAYTKETLENGTEIYHQIALGDFKFVDHFDGTVKLGLNDDASEKVKYPTQKVENDETLYVYGTQLRATVKKDQTWYYKDKDGNYAEYTIPADTTLSAGVLPETETDTNIKTIAQQIEAFNQSTVIPMGINGYKDGFMYYTFPVEHLGNSGQKQEGDYGFVGNHWYELTINSVTSIGYGIFDPAEDIIPNDKNREFYGLGYEMQVCPWHVKEKEVILNPQK